MNLTSPLVEFGINQALADHGIDHSMFRRYKSASAALANHGGSKRLMLKMASALLAFNGMQASPSYALMTKMANVEKWNPFYDYIAGGVMEGIRLYEKRANDLGMIGDVASAAAKTSPSLWHTLLMASALLGSSTGALSWHYGRDVAEDDVNNAELQAQIRQYRGMAEDVDSSVRSRKDKVLPETRSFT